MPVWRGNYGEGALFLNCRTIYSDIFVNKLWHKLPDRYLVLRFLGTNLAKKDKDAALESIPTTVTAPRVIDLM